MRAGYPRTPARPGSQFCRLEAVEPLRFHRVWYLTPQIRGGRSGTRRVFEGKGVGIADLFDQRQRRPKILLALAREADDEVGRERHFWLGCAHARNGFDIGRTGVAAVHALEDAVGTRLHG